MNPERNRPVSLEDLLRLKQAERPPAEFWGEFDRKLREKQLAALVAKRPWWQRLPRLAPVLVRYRLVLGGSTVAVLALLALPDRSPSSDPAPGSDGLAQVQAVEAVPTAEWAVTGLALAPEVAPALPAVESAPTLGAPALAVAEAGPAEPAATEAVVVDTFPAIVALGGGAVSTVEDEESPSARHIAANLAALRDPDQAVAGRVLVGANGFESRVMPARTKVDPLQQMTPPGESRRSRLLTAMVSTAALETSSRSTERAANRFAEEGVYDQIQRFGARGDRLQVKF